MSHPPFSTLSLEPNTLHPLTPGQGEWVFVIPTQNALTLIENDLRFRISPGQLLGPVTKAVSLEAESRMSLLTLRLPKAEDAPINPTQSLFSLTAKGEPERLRKAMASLGLAQTLRCRHVPPGGVISGVQELGGLTHLCVEGEGSLREGGQRLDFHPGETLRAPQGTFQEIQATGHLTLLTCYEGSATFFFPQLRCGARSIACSLSQALGQGLLRIDSAGTILSHTPEGRELLRLDPSEQSPNLLGLLDDEGRRWLRGSLSQSPDSLPAQGFIDLPGKKRAQVALFPYGSGERAPEFLLALNPQNQAEATQALSPDGALFKTLGLEPALRTLAPHPGWVILWGEGGSRRRAFGEILHQRSPWVRGPLRAFHIGKLTPSQLERALLRGLPGFLDRRLQANVQGTLLLEGFEDHSPSERVDLFRALTEVGAHPQAAGLRLVCIMEEQPHQGLPPTQSAAGLKQRGPFTLLRIPSLKERPDSIPALLHQLLEEHKRLRSLSFTGEALAALRHHPWPDNLDGLARFAQGISLQSFEGPVSLEDVKKHLGSMGDSPPEGRRFQTLFEAEGIHIKAALEATNGNKAQAAKLLGLTRTRLYRKIAEHQLEMHG